ncbi:MAG: ParB/RepB/Spo0J family partition protein [Porticoccaceae bacterium]|jgi:ParB family chromosome partitioning protein|nr:ParB/RepB/Spo0J family partition protein [Porticoccaceae bacterium]
MAKGADLSGLDDFGDFNVSSLLGGSNKKDSTPQGNGDQVEAGAIAYAPLENFHEDPENARKEFDAGKLQELADSMQQVNPTTGKPRGIMEPLSVKHHPEQPGHFIINGGNRRYRAADLAGLEQVPYIIKDELDDFDKFVLNDQRENLSPLEIALFIKSRLEDGHKAGEIAKALGRPPSYVSDHKIFFDMASCIRDLYDSSLCRSMQALALLHRGYKKHGDEIEEFCQEASANQQELTTSQVRAFLDSLKEPAKPKDPEPAAPIGGDQEPQAGGDAAQSELEDDQEPEPQDGGEDDNGNQDEERPAPLTRDEDQQPLTLDGEPLSGGHLDELEEQADQYLADDAKADKIKKAIIQVKYDEREARLLTDRRAAYGLAWIKHDDDGHEIEVDLNQVQLVAIIEA